VAIFAILVGIAGSAFTSRHVAAPTTMNWYVLTADADPTLAASYTLSTTEPTCEADPEFVCAIQVDDSGTNPTQAHVNGVITSSNSFTRADSNVKYKE